MKKIISVTLIIGIIACLAVFGLVACKDTSTNYPNGDKYTVGGGSYDASAVQSLNVAWAKGQATITFSDEYSQITVSEENSVTDTQYVIHRWLDSEGTLWVKAFAAEITDDGESQTFEKKILTITLPKMTLKELYVENHGYHIAVTGASAETIKTYNTGTSTSVSSSSAKDLSMESHGITGSLSYAGSVTGEVKMSSVQKCSLQTATMPTSITMSGKETVSAYIPTNTGFTADVSSSSTTTIDFAPLVDGTSEDASRKVYTYGNGSVAIRMTCQEAIIGDQNVIKIKDYSSLITA